VSLYDDVPLIVPYGGSSGGGSISGFVRVEDGRFRNDAGWLGVRALTEFSMPYLCSINRHDEVARRLDRAVATRRNCVRYLLMAKYLFSFTPGQFNYWQSIERAVDMANDRGLYVEGCLFADAQELLPFHHDRVALVREYAGWCSDRPGVIPQLANEPFKNGWESATDPKLLELAREFAAIYKSRQFSVGDPVDFVTSESEGQPLRGELNTLARTSDMLVLHGDRHHDPARYARWVDHLKGFTDFRDDPTIRRCGLWHDEPMGMASVFVPGRRDNRAEALVAAAACTAIFQMAFTTHYISEQDDLIPGLEESAFVADIPHGPDWQYINAGVAHSPVTGFDGFEKVRPCTNGREAWACAYGHHKGTIRWADGFTPTRVFNGANVEVWRATK